MNLKTLLSEENPQVPDEIIFGDGTLTNELCIANTIGENNNHYVRYD